MCPCPLGSCPLLQPFDCLLKNGHSSLTNRLSPARRLRTKYFHDFPLRCLLITAPMMDSIFNGKGSKNPKRILHEGRADVTQYSIPQILPASEGVLQLTVERIKSQGVEGKVSAGSGLFEG